MTEQLDKDGIFRTPIQYRNPSAAEMFRAAIAKENSRKCVKCGFDYSLASGYTGGVAEIEFLCRNCWMKPFIKSDAPPETAILSQSAPKYSLKTQLWIGAWIFLSIASGVALGFMKGCR